MRLLAVVIGVLMALGCESKGRDSRQTPENETGRLVFEEASTGLPSSGRWRQTITFCDINGDGHMDILAPPARLAEDRYRTPFAWLGDGKGGWSEFPLKVPDDLAYGYGGIAAGDFDGDGVQDIGLAMHDLGLHALKGVGGLAYQVFSSGLPWKEEFASRALVSADMNGDGVSDMVALSEAEFGQTGTVPSGVRVCYGASGGWTCASVGERASVQELFGDQLTTGDINGDGHRDIAVGSLNHRKDLIVWLSDGKGGFVPFNQGLPRELHYPWVDLADVDQDGKDELIASITGFGKAGFGSIRVFSYRPEGFEEMSQGLPTNTMFFAVRACDLDQHGGLEIVGGTGEGGITVFSQKEGIWHKVESIPGLPETGLYRISGVYCVDLNGDGKKDIVVNSSGGDNAAAGGIRVFLNRTGSRKTGS